MADLEKDFDLFGPIKKIDEAVFSKNQFAPITASHNLELHYSLTTLPPSKYLFPAHMKIFAFNRGKIQKEKTEKTRKKIIFGLSLTDLTAINRLDIYFSQPLGDEIYQKNRKNFLLVGVDHEPPLADSQFDLYFQTKNDNTFYVHAKSSAGQNIISSSSYIKEVDDKLDEPATKPLYDPEILTIIEKSKNDPIWNELASKCLDCGICSYVCPLCYCFETEDKLDIDSSPTTDCQKCTGTRERRWDSCLNHDFAAVANENFRPQLADRLYNWYFHKFVRSPKEYGFSGCVDCERCVVFCPAKINFHETIVELKKKYL